jgi:hypothetical protein
MEKLTVELAVPVNVYQKLEEQPPEIREAALQVAVQAISSYLEHEARLVAGREMLRRLPAEAEHFTDKPPHDLASNHDAYLYGDH